jgi:hypothetical protein
MPTLDFIPALFYEVDEPRRAIPTPPHARLWPSAVVPLGLLQALKGGGNRAFYRWRTRDYRALFPQLPERPRLFRLCMTPQDWPQGFLASPPVLGGLDPSGMALLHPLRAGRSPQQIGRTGLSQHRWRVGGTRCLLWNPGGVVVGWACATAHVAATTFQGLVRQCEEQRMVRSDTACHAAAGAPTNLTLCQRGEWQNRLRVEPGLSMLTLVCHGKKGMPRGWTSFHARLAFTMAAFPLLVQWHGFQPNASGFVPRSITELSL